MFTVSHGLAKAQLDRDTIRRDAKRNLSDHQDYLELKMSKEFSTFTKQLVKGMFCWCFSRDRGITKEYRQPWCSKIMSQAHEIGLKIMSFLKIWKMLGTCYSSPGFWDVRVLVRSHFKAFLRNHEGHRLTFSKWKLRFFPSDLHLGTATWRNWSNIVQTVKKSWELATLHGPVHWGGHRCRLHGCSGAGVPGLTFFLLTSHDLNHSLWILSWGLFVWTNSVFLSPFCTFSHQYLLLLWYLMNCQSLFTAELTRRVNL